MTDIEAAHEAIACGAISLGVRFLAGRDVAKTEAVIKALTLALLLDDDDKRMVEDWLKEREGGA